MSRAAFKMQHRIAAMVFDGWRGAALLHQSARRCLARMSNLKLSSSLQAWVSFVLELQRTRSVVVLGSERCTVPSLRQATAHRQRGNSLP